MSIKATTPVSDAAKLGGQEPGYYQPGKNYCIGRRTEAQNISAAAANVVVLDDFTISGSGVERYNGNYIRITKPGLYLVTAYSRISMAAGTVAYMILANGGGNEIVRADAEASMSNPAMSIVHMLQVEDSAVVCLMMRSAAAATVEAGRTQVAVVKLG